MVVATVQNIDMLSGIKRITKDLQKGSSNPGKFLEHIEDWKIMTNKKFNKKSYSLAIGDIQMTSNEPVGSINYIKTASAQSSSKSSKSSGDQRDQFYIRQIQNKSIDDLFKMSSSTFAKQIFSGSDYISIEQNSGSSYKKS